MRSAIRHETLEADLSCSNDPDKNLSQTYFFVLDSYYKN